MKILFINHYAGSPGYGMELRPHLLSRKLAEMGHQVLVAGASFSHLRAKQPEMSGKEISLENFEGVEYLWLSTPPYKGNGVSRIRNMLAFRPRVFKALATGNFGIPDVIIGSTLTHFAADAARKLARFYSVPFVYEVRDLWPLTPIELGGYSRWHPFLLYLDYLDRKLARSADLIITTAPLMKEYYKERFGIPDEKFLWITNGTDLELFKDLPDVGENEEKDTFDIYYAGAHGLANGLDKIFDQLTVIMARHPQVRLTLVGDGPLKQHLIERAGKENLPVRFLDAVPKKELPAILNKADALLVYLEPCSLYRYGISLNKLADYHAMGKPILFVGDCAENPVIQSGAGMVAKTIEEFPSIVEKMIRMNPEEKKLMGEKGRSYAEENYNWEKLAKITSDTLKGLL